MVRAGGRAGLSSGRPRSCRPGRLGCACVTGYAAHVLERRRRGSAIPPHHDTEDREADRRHPHAGCRSGRRVQLARLGGLSLGVNRPDAMDLPDRCLDGRQLGDAGSESHIAPNTAQHTAPSAEHSPPRVAAGEVDCARCQERIQPGQEWDLATSTATACATRAPSTDTRVTAARVETERHPDTASSGRCTSRRTRPRSREWEPDRRIGCRRRASSG